MKSIAGGLNLFMWAGYIISLALDAMAFGSYAATSAAFLLVYAAVNAGHLLVLRQTGANALIVWLSLLTCLAMFAVLVVYILQQQSAAIAALVFIAAASFAAECLYRRWTGRKINAIARRTL